MVSFLLFVAFADRLFIGEFGAESTDPALLLLGFICSIYGFIGGCRAATITWDAVRDRRRPPPRLAIEAAVLWATQLGAFFVWALRLLPIDHLLLVLAAVATCALALANRPK